MGRFQVFNILMGTDQILFKFDHGDTDVRTVVSKTFQICQKIIEDESVFQSTFSFSDTLCMIDFNFITQIIDMLFQRLDPVCKRNIVSDKSFP